MGRNKQLKNISVFTGSIINHKNNEMDGLIMNIPTKMFKIIVFENNAKDYVYMEIMIAENKPYYVDLDNPKFNLNHY